MFLRFRHLDKETTTQTSIVSSSFFIFHESSPTTGPAPDSFLACVIDAVPQSDLHLSKIDIDSARGE
jgi:hypothetical protein